MMNLILLAVVLSFGAPTAQPASSELDSEMSGVAVCSEDSVKDVTAGSPIEQDALAPLASAEPEANVSDSVTLADESPGIRYCCTTQQSLACAAQGGTTSCRTGVCQCLF